MKPTAAEKRHMARVAALPCIACGNGPYVEVHHVVGYADRMGRLSKSHRLVTPLCTFCHRTGSLAVHAGSHRKFYADWGVDLLAKAKRLEAESVALGILEAV